MAQAERMRASKVARRQTFNSDEASASSAQTKQSEEAVTPLDSSFSLPVTTVEAGDTDSSGESDGEYDANLTVDEAIAVRAARGYMFSLQTHLVYIYI